MPPRMVVYPVHMNTLKALSALSGLLKDSMKLGEKCIGDQGMSWSGEMEWLDLIKTYCKHA